MYGCESVLVRVLGVCVAAQEVEPRASPRCGAQNESLIVAFSGPSMLARTEPVQAPSSVQVEGSSRLGGSPSPHAQVLLLQVSSIRSWEIFLTYAARATFLRHPASYARISSSR